MGTGSNRLSAASTTMSVGPPRLPNIRDDCPICHTPLVANPAGRDTMHLGTRPVVAQLIDIMDEIAPMATALFLSPRMSEECRTEHVRIGLRRCLVDELGLTTACSDCPESLVVAPSQTAGFTLDVFYTRCEHCGVTNHTPDFRADQTTDRHVDDYARENPKDSNCPSPDHSQR